MRMLQAVTQATRRVRTGPGLGDTPCMNRGGVEDAAALRIALMQRYGRCGAAAVLRDPNRGFSALRPRNESLPWIYGSCTGQYKCSINWRRLESDAAVRPSKMSLRGRGRRDGTPPAEGRA